MKKIPTLYRRNPEDMRRLLPKVHPDCGWVLAGEGEATAKIDGTGTLLDDAGRWWARREVKKDKTPPPNFVAVEHDDVCTNCRSVQANSEIGAGSGAQIDRGTAGVSQCVVREEGRGGSVVSAEVERQPEQPPGDLRGVPGGFSGSKGAPNLLPGVREPVERGNETQAAGQSETVASGFGKQAEGMDQQAGISDGLPARSSASRWEGVRSGTSGGDGDGTGPIAGAGRERAPQEWSAGRQPSRESGAVDQAAAVRGAKRRNGALPDLPVCRVCGITTVTGKTVGWEPIEQSSFAKIHQAVLDAPEDTFAGNYYAPGTYELVGPKINGNPHGLDRHLLTRHGVIKLQGVPTGFDALRDYLLDWPADGWPENVEGVVWHHPDGRRAKIKIRDFTAGCAA